MIVDRAGRHRPAGRRGVPADLVHDRPRRRTLVSLAGPAANLVLAVVLLALIRLLYDPDHLVLWSGMAFLGFLQVTAVVLNLLPIPGLDGYDALEPHLSPETQRALAPAKQYGFFILFVRADRRPAPVDLRGGAWFFDFSGVPDALVGRATR